MVNPEHLAILKQGVEAWNRWRQENRGIPNLQNSNLAGADLRGVNLDDTDLNGANLSGACLIGSRLRRAELVGSNLQKGDLVAVHCMGSDFSGADLTEARLMGSDFSKAKFDRARLASANLVGANFNDADLSETNFNRANLTGVSFARAQFNETNLAYAILKDVLFSQTSLLATKGLEHCYHSGPSSIDHRTLMQSPNLPLEFLRGIGLPDDYIEYLSTFRNLPFQYYSCFISHSHPDEDFVKRLHADLQGNGVRCWYAPEDLKIGDKFRPVIHESIRLYDKLLLILSERSIASSWVEEEVVAALDKEERYKKDGQDKTVLFPIRLDEAVMEIDVGWAATVRRTRHIGDFREWKDHDAYTTSFDRLLRDLKGEIQKK